MKIYVSVIVFALLVSLLIESSMLCLSKNVSTMACIEQEKQALLKFKASFEDPLNWLSSWKNGSDCCQWDGIRCNTITGNVVKLDISDPCSSSDHVLPDICNWGDYKLLSHQVNPSLLELKYLSHLDMSGNNFNGIHIPTFLGSMKQLKHLSLSQSNFSGRIPHNLGNLTNLLLLDLSSNDLHIDDIYWVSQLRSLHHLDLTDIYLGKAHTLFQVLNMLPSLLQIHLKHCEIGGMPIPPNVTSLARVQVLDIANNALQSPFLTALQNMTSLRILDLSFNKLNSVPSWLAKCNNLVELKMRENALHGPIPDALRNLTSIKLLDLSNNSLTSIPSWFSELKRLTHLDISQNELTAMARGFVSSILRNNCDLQMLDLSDNKLKGEAFWGHENASRCLSYKLEELYLSYNEFSGCLPSWLGDSEELEIYLGSKSFVGSITSSLGKLSNLIVLNLDSNSFVGSIPSSLGKLSNLRVLNLDSNSFVGPLPSALGKLSNLDALWVSNNLLNGTIPYDFRHLVNLKSLDLSGNKLEGEVPDSIGHLSSLIELFLSDNNLQGVIPQSIGQLVNLTTLVLSSNNFHGLIPESLERLVNLEVLDLSDNHLSGIIPEIFGQFEKMETLYLSRNDLRGKVPNSFGHVENLDLSSNALEGSISKMERSQYLYQFNLSNNKITGPLPKNMSDIMPNLGFLYLRNNHINGSIPNSICKIESFFILDLSKNMLSGEIPDCWRDVYGFWIEINLSFNKLTGVIPSSFGNLSSLSSLHLNSNNLQGALPLSMRNLKSLVTLDLGGNQLSGTVLSWTRDTSPLLQILRLRQNMFNGPIPSQLCQLSTLKILDLGENKLTGQIPECIGRMKGMFFQKSSNTETPLAKYPRFSSWYSEEVQQIMKGRELDYSKNLKFLVNMDLSNNNLVGSIPKEITILTGLQGLNLSHNHLFGAIPERIGDMKSLESIDISYNHLSGTIPNSMSKLTWLSHLNLSYNNLSGPIPQGNQLSTLGDAYIYAGNPYLCGQSLQNKCPSEEIDQCLECKGEVKDEDGKDDQERIWFYFVVVLGFLTGFWSVIGVLFLKKTWRYAYFKFAEMVVDKFYVTFAIMVAKVKMKMEGRKLG